MVLSERGLAPTKDERARIEKCTDIAQLDTWLKRAITAASASEVLAAVPVAPKPAPGQQRTRRSTRVRAVSGNPPRAAR